MGQGRLRPIWARGMAAALIALSGAAPLSAGVQDGVDAWSRGDYVAAIAEWQGPARAGDPDALFNLAQAYRLGLGVPTDMTRAMALYADAAAAGHVQAADTYGLMLFQDGKHAEALPYVAAAARRGDPRAQYLLGVAHFNGDHVPRDWLRAYALLTLANAQQLPQAVDTLRQMDTYIPLAQRQQAAALARELEAEAREARGVELAAADLALQRGAEPARAGNAADLEKSPSATAAQDEPSPSPVAAARMAVARAREASGTADPAGAGASHAQAWSVTPATLTSMAAPAKRTAAPEAESGPWRVQLGAFSVPGNAERLWTRVSEFPALAGTERLLIPVRGRAITKLQAGGFPSRNEAQRACNALKANGQDCLVTRE